MSKLSPRFLRLVTFLMLGALFMDPRIVQGVSKFSPGPKSVGYQSASVEGVGIFSELEDPAPLEEGQDLKLRVAANLNILYPGGFRWFRNNVQLTGLNTESPLTDSDGAVSGYLSTMTIAGAKREDSGLYYCEMTGKFGEVLRSKMVNVLVVKSPELILRPKSQVLVNQRTLKLSVEPKYGTTATFNYPSGVVVDKEDNDTIYVADTENHMIRKVGPGGGVSLFAGTAGSIANLRAGSKGAITRGFDYFKNMKSSTSTERYNNSLRLAVDGRAGYGAALDWATNYYNIVRAGTVELGEAGAMVGDRKIILDSNGSRFCEEPAVFLYVRRPDQKYSLTTPQGTAEVDFVSGAGFQDGPIARARLNKPQAVAIAPDGKLYVADTGNNLIRLVDLREDDPMMITVAGDPGRPEDPLNSVASESGAGFQDGESGSGVVFTANISPSIRISSALVAYEGAPIGGNLTSAAIGGGSIRVDSSSKLSILNPGSLASTAPIELEGVLGAGTASWVLLAGGSIESVSVNKGGGGFSPSNPPRVYCSAPELGQGEPNWRSQVEAGSIALATGSFTAIVDTVLQGCRVAKPGLVTGVPTISGGTFTAYLPSATAGGTATLKVGTITLAGAAYVNSVSVIDPGRGMTAGTFSIVGSDGTTVLAAGSISTTVKKSVVGLNKISGGAGYVASSVVISSENNISAQPPLVTLAGGTSDSTPRLRKPTGLKVDSYGNVLIADSENHSIRILIPVAVDSNDASAGNYYKLYTVAGSGASNYGNDDGIGATAKFYTPTDVAIEESAAGYFVYVADSNNHTIRKITFPVKDGKLNLPSDLADLKSRVTVSTHAGAAGIASYVNGAGTDARFDQPTKLEMDSSGGSFRLYVSEAGNSVIRLIAAKPNGGCSVATVAGASVRASGYTDGIGASARFQAPKGMGFDSRGNLLIADSGNHVIRQYSAALDGVATLAGSPKVKGQLDNRNSQIQEFFYSWYKDGYPLTNGYYKDGLPVSDTGVDREKNEWTELVSGADTETLKITANSSTGSGYLKESHSGQYSVQVFSGAPENWRMYTETTPTKVTVRTATFQPIRSTVVPGDTAVSVDLGPLVKANVFSATGAELSGPVYSLKTLEGGTPPSWITQVGVGQPKFLVSPPLMQGRQTLYFDLSVSDAIQKHKSLWILEIRPVDESLSSVPIIIQQPLAQMVKVDGFAKSISVSAQGDGLKYQWYRNGTEIPGAVQSTLTLSQVRAGDAAFYHAKVSNDSGSVECKKVQLSVIPAPEIAVAPSPTVLDRNAENTSSTKRLTVTPRVHTDTLLKNPSGLTLNRATGDLKVADQGNQVIRNVTLGGEVSAVVGASGVPGDADSSGLAVQLNGPSSIANGVSSTQIIADSGNGKVKRLSDSDRVKTVFSGLNKPTGVVSDRKGNLFVTENDSHTVRVIHAVESVIGVKVTSSGTGLISSPTVVFSGTSKSGDTTGGVGAKAEADIANGMLKAVRITNPGTGYKYAPEVRFLDSTGALIGGLEGEAVLSGQLDETNVEITSGGSGYQSPPDVTISGGGVEQAEVRLTVSGGAIVSAIVSNPGQGYFQEPKVSFSGSGTGAVAQAVVESGTIKRIKLLQGGSGYAQNTTTISLSGGGLRGAVGAARMGLNSAKLLQAGSGYTTAPTVQFIPEPVNGTPAKAEVTLGLFKVDIQDQKGIVLDGAGILYGGTGYTAANGFAAGSTNILVTDPSGGTATAKVFFDSLGRAGTISITNSGKGLSEPLSFTLPSSPVAGGTFTLSGSGFRLSNVAGGSYTQIPTVKFLWEGGSGAAADPVMGVNEVQVTASGINYTRRPKVIFGKDSGGVGAAATAYMGVSKIGVVDGGGGYLASPQILLGTGGAAVAQAYMGVSSVEMGTASGTYQLSGTTVFVPKGGTYQYAPEVTLDWGRDVYNRWLGAAKGGTFAAGSVTTSVSGGALSVQLASGGTGYFGINVVPKVTVVATLASGEIKAGTIVLGTSSSGTLTYDGALPLELSGLTDVSSAQAILTKPDFREAVVQPIFTAASATSVRITGFSVVDAGTGYLSEFPPTVSVNAEGVLVFSPDKGGSLPIATASVSNGTVSSVALQVGSGSGTFDGIPNVRVVGGASVKAKLGFPITDESYGLRMFGGSFAFGDSPLLVENGSGKFTSAPTFQIDSGTGNTNAKGTAIMGLSRLGDENITGATYAFTKAPVVTVTGTSGVSNVGSARLSFSVTNSLVNGYSPLPVTKGGSYAINAKPGMTTPGTITFGGGTWAGGTIATGTAWMGPIVSIMGTADWESGRNMGYSSVPRAVFPLTVSGTGGSLTVSSPGAWTLSGGSWTGGGSLGVTALVAGTQSSNAFNASDIAYDTLSGSLFMTDSERHVIWAVKNGSVAMHGTIGVSGSADGSSTIARFNQPKGITAYSGTVYVSEWGNNRVRMFKGSTWSTLESPNVQLRYPTGLAVGGSVSGGSILYVADSGNHQIVAYSVLGNTGGTWSLIAGSYGVSGGGTVSSSGVAAKFNWPTGLVYASTISGGGTAGLYVTDSLNRVVRQVLVSDSQRTVNLFAGSLAAENYTASGGSSSFNANIGSVDGLGSNARFIYPSGITWFGGTLFVSDDCSVRRITASSATSGSVTLHSGSLSVNGSLPGFVDGSASGSRFFSPQGITVNGTTLYLADKGNGVVRTGSVGTGSFTTLSSTARIGLRPGTITAGSGGATAGYGTSGSLTVSGAMGVSGYAYATRITGSGTFGYSLMQIDNGGTYSMVPTVDFPAPAQVPGAQRPTATVYTGVGLHSLSFPQGGTGKYSPTYVRTNTLTSDYFVISGTLSSDLPYTQAAVHDSTNGLMPRFGLRGGLVASNGTLQITYAGSFQTSPGITKLGTTGIAVEPLMGLSQVSITNPTNRYLKIPVVAMRGKLSTNKSTPPSISVAGTLRFDVDSSGSGYSMKGSSTASDTRTLWGDGGIEMGSITLSVNNGSIAIVVTTSPAEKYPDWIKKQMLPTKIGSTTLQVPGGSTRVVDLDKTFTDDLLAEFGVSGGSNASFKHPSFNVTGVSVTDSGLGLDYTSSSGDLILAGGSSDSTALSGNLVSGTTSLARTLTIKDVFVVSLGTAGYKPGDSLDTVKISTGTVSGTAPASFEIVELSMISAGAADKAQAGRGYSAMPTVEFKDAAAFKMPSKSEAGTTYGVNCSLTHVGIRWDSSSGLGRGYTSEGTMVVTGAYGFATFGGTAYSETQAKAIVRHGLSLVGVDLWTDKDVNTTSLDYAACLGGAKVVFPPASNGFSKNALGAFYSRMAPDVRFNATSSGGARALAAVTVSGNGMLDSVPVCTISGGTSAAGSVSAEITGVTARLDRVDFDGTQADGTPNAGWGYTAIPKITISPASDDLGASSSYEMSVGNKLYLRVVGLKITEAGSGYNGLTSGGSLSSDKTNVVYKSLSDALTLSGGGGDGQKPKIYASGSRPFTVVDVPILSSGSLYTNSPSQVSFGRTHVVRGRIVSGSTLQFADTAFASSLSNVGSYTHEILMPAVSGTWTQGLYGPGAGKPFNNRIFLSGTVSAGSWKLDVLNEDGITKQALSTGSDVDPIMIGTYTAMIVKEVPGVTASQFEAVASVKGLKVSGINVVDSGGGYGDPPSVTVDGPNKRGGSGNTAVAKVGGMFVKSVELNEPGSGYTATPSVSFSSDSGGGATAAVTSLRVVGINMTSQGTGYTSAPSDIIVEPKSADTAAVQAVVDIPKGLSVAGIALTNKGSGYTSVPTVVLTGGNGSGAAAQVESLEVVGLKFSDTGGGYGASPKVGFSLSSGTLSADFAEPVVEVYPIDLNAILGVTVISGGTGYSSDYPPDVVFTGGGGKGAEAVAVVENGVVKKVNITKRGSGYVTAPTVELSGDGTGALVVASVSEASYVIGARNSDGTPAKTAGIKDGNESSGVMFNRPSGIAIDGNGNLILCDTENSVIRQISSPLTADSSGKRNYSVKTVAGLGGYRGFIDGVGSTARFNSPEGIVCVPDSTLGVDAGVLFVADSGNNAIRRINLDGEVRTVAGTGLRGSANGSAGAALFSSPKGIDIDGSGNLYVADYANHAIRKITPAGTVSTLSGVMGVAGLVNSSVADEYKFQWRYNGKDIEGATGSYLDISEKDGSTGLYDVVVTNLYGSTTSQSVVVAERTKAQVVQDLATEKLVQFKSGFELSLVVAGQPEPSYRWSRWVGGGWEELFDGGPDWNGTTTNKLTLNAAGAGPGGSGNGAQPGHSGLYRVQITDVDGETSFKTCEVKVLHPPILGNRVRDLRSISTQGDFNLAVSKSDSRLWSWGANLSGQLGINGTENQSIPLPTGVTASWLKAVAGGKHGVGIRLDGAIYSWGDNHSAQLGNGGVQPAYNTNSRVGAEKEKFWLDVAAGASHSLAIRAEKYYGPKTSSGWGVRDSAGKLKAQKISELNLATVDPKASWLRGNGEPTDLEGNVGDYFIDQSAGGTIWGWGNNDSGQLGSDPVNPVYSPRKVVLPSGVSESDWISVFAGWDNSAAIDSQGRLYMWGNNDKGQLADSGSVYVDGSYDGRMIRIKVNLTGDSSEEDAAFDMVKTVSIGRGHILAVKHDKYYGPKANGSWRNESSEFVVNSISENRDGLKSASGNWLRGAGEPTDDVGEDGDYYVDTKSGGILLGWGSNSDSCISGSLDSGIQPVTVIESDIATATTVAAGFDHSLAIDAAGKLWSWGANDRGQLGRDYTDPSVWGDPTWVSVGMPEDLLPWTMVSAGNKHSLGTTDDGMLWSWGANHMGQVGNGSFGDRVSRVIVTASGSGFVAKPKVLFTGGGSDKYDAAAAETSLGGALVGGAVLNNGAVTGVNLSGRGAFYSKAPTVTFSPDKGALAVATLDEIEPVKVGSIGPVFMSNGRPAMFGDSDASLKIAVCVISNDASGSTIYSWRRGSSAIEAGTRLQSDVLTYRLPLPAFNGDYTLQVSNSIGSGTSQSVKLLPLPEIGVEVVTVKGDTFANELVLAADQSITIKGPVLSALPGGTEAAYNNPTYEWEFLPAGSETWGEIPSNVSKLGKASIRMTEATVYNSGIYRSKLTLNFGRDYSKAEETYLTRSYVGTKTVTVVAKPVLNLAERATTLKPSSRGSANALLPTYLKRGDSVSLITWAENTKPTAVPLKSVEVPVAGIAGKYAGNSLPVTFQDADTGAIVQGDSATAIIQGGVLKEIRGGVFVKTYTKPPLVLVGGVVEDRVQAILDSGVSYGWYKGSTEGAVSLVSGTNSPRFDIVTSDLDASDNVSAVYIVKAKNSAGEEPLYDRLGDGQVLAWNVVLQWPAKITSQPAASTSVVTGESATLQVGVSAPSGKADYKWIFYPKAGGEPVDLSEREGKLGCYGGATARLVIPSTSIQNQGTYRVSVSNKYYTTGGALVASTPEVSTASSLVVLSKVEPPSVSVNAMSGSGSYPQGSNVTLAVTAKGNPLSYQWYKGAYMSASSLVPNNAIKLAGETNPTLSLTNIQSSQSGIYTVEISNALGKVRVSANVAVSKSSTGGAVSSGTITISNKDLLQSLVTIPQIPKSSTLPAGTVLRLSGTAPQGLQVKGWRVRSVSPGGVQKTYTLPTDGARIIVAAGTNEIEAILGRNVAGTYFGVLSEQSGDLINSDTGLKDVRGTARVTVSANNTVSGQINVQGILGSFTTVISDGVGKFSFLFNKMVRTGSVLLDTESALGQQVRVILQNFPVYGPDGVLASKGLASDAFLQTSNLNGTAAFTAAICTDETWESFGRGGVMHVNYTPTDGRAVIYGKVGSGQSFSYSQPSVSRYSKVSDQVSSTLGLETVEKWEDKLQGVEDVGELLNLVEPEILAPASNASFVPVFWYPEGSKAPVLRSLAGGLVISETSGIVGVVGAQGKRNLVRGFSYEASGKRAAPFDNDYLTHINLYSSQTYSLGGLGIDTLYVFGSNYPLGTATNLEGVVISQYDPNLSILTSTALAGGVTFGSYLDSNSKEPSATNISFGARTGVSNLQWMDVDAAGAFTTAKLPTKGLFKFSFVEKNTDFATAKFSMKANKLQSQVDCEIWGVVIQSPETSAIAPGGYGFLFRGSGNRATAEDFGNVLGTGEVEAVKSSIFPTQTIPRTEAVRMVPN